MMTLLPIYVLGVLIVLFAGRLVVQAARGGKAKPVVTVEDYAAAREEVDELLVATAAIERVFAKEDVQFVSETCPVVVQQLFRQERGKLAIEWIRLSQRRLAHLMDLHLKLASYTFEPCARLEIGLAVRYWSFLVASHFILLLLRLRGPVETAAIVHYLVRVPGNLCGVFAPRLKNIDLVRLRSNVDLVQ